VGDSSAFLWIWCEVLCKFGTCCSSQCRRVRMGINSWLSFKELGDLQYRLVGEGNMFCFRYLFHFSLNGVVSRFLKISFDFFRGRLIYFITFLYPIWRQFNLGYSIFISINWIIKDWVLGGYCSNPYDASKAGSIRLIVFKVVTVFALYIVDFAHLIHLCWFFIQILFV